LSATDWQAIAATAVQNQQSSVIVCGQHHQAGKYYIRYNAVVEQFLYPTCI